MEYLFDPNKPHFGVWRSLHDIDTPPFSSIFFDSENAQRSASAPIYYAALYGFHDLVEHLIIKYLQDVNASGGYFVRPLVAALAKKHFQTAELLHHNSADLHCQGNAMMSPLHLKAENGDVKVAQKLIKYGVDINAEDLHGCTPLHVASLCSNHKDGSDGSTPLHNALSSGILEVVRSLLEQGADITVEDNDGKTALRVAELCGNEDIKELLLDHKAK
ncbi:ankyrin repeat-containing domain protein [Russula ochroleuca]|uniref:Ankyrin repeat-containing domain protein n=1 Tax=Russula ochroleuca TaxID=152965 RepID=A0A9P5MRW8_9AGAM|nr:ankyrin repeat-containing domain protein [Russula ochroleuca]